MSTRTNRLVLITSVFTAFTAAAAFDVPDAWRPVPFKGADSDFLFMAPIVYERQSAAFEDAAARFSCISNMTRSIRFLPVHHADGSFTYDLNVKVPATKPFVGILYPRVSVSPRDVLINPVRHDRAAYETWLKAHPNFLGFATCEYFNDITMPLREDGRDHMKWLFTKDSSQTITDDEFTHICNREEYRRAFGNAQEITTNLVSRYLARLIEMQFGDAPHAMIGEGTFCVEHLVAYAGAGALGIETTRNYRPYQILELFCRGAARQFGLPWYWYIATYFHGVESNGKFNPNGYRTARRNGQTDGPNFGISLSAIERTMWKTWLSGAASYEREAMIESIFETDRTPWKLSDEGEVYDRFYHIASTRERGVPYTPFALLVPAARGESRQLGQPYLSNMKCPYTHADHMTDAILATALDFPKNMTMKALKSGVERVMTNSKYGDLFDALTPDFPDQTSFRRTLPAYPCAILCGEYGENPEMAAILRDYVEKGGTLVLSSAQLRTFPVDLAELKPLENREFCEVRMGKGRVIVGRTPYLTTWEGANEAEASKKAMASISLGEPERFENIEWLLDELSRRFAPVTVCGDVQWGLNRTKDGWLLYLINNAGVIKFADKAPEFLPGGSAVEADLGRLAVLTAKDILSDNSAAIEDGVLKTAVPHGGVAILELK
ncbi:MAG TPA: hypothetical protein PKI32_00370 [Opitutales bacterium]|nr:hypothetical protein [Opitutales bacterium]